LSLLEAFWRFVAHRPGLGATATEWRAALGDDAWEALRPRIFVGDGVAACCAPGDSGRSLRVVPGRAGYQLVCATTGVVGARCVPEDEVRCYRLDIPAVRDALAAALGIDAEPGSVRDIPRAFPLGDWRPVEGVALPAYLMFPPTSKLLRTELHRLLLAAGDGFVLFVPEPPRIDRPTRDLLDQKKATVVALNEVIASDGSVFIATATWQTYRDAYRAKHLPDRMVPAQPDYQFARKGLWAIRFAGRETFLDGDLKGAAFIHHLLLHQGRRIHVVRLMADVAGAARSRITPAAEGLMTDRAAADDATDERAIRECQDRYDALVAERNDADPDRQAEIEAEIAQIAAYLSSALGLGGKSRKMGDEVDKARRRIARVINTAYGKIEASDAELALHFRNSIKTHTEMVYEPDQEVNWVLS
jgi:hypothetical protein